MSKETAEKSKSILFLAHSFIKDKSDISGYFLFILAKGLIKKDYKVYVLAPHSCGLKSYEEIEGVKIYRFRYMWNRLEGLAYQGNMDELVRKSLLNKIIFVSFLFFFWIRTLGLSDKFKIDLIHSHWLLPGGFVGYLAAVFCGKPLLVTLHGTDLRIIKSSRSARVLGKVILKKASHISTVSNFLKQGIMNRLNIEEGKISVIPMPVNTEKIKMVSQFDRPSKKIVLCVARYTKQKRLDICLEALSFLKKKKIDFEAWLVGFGPEQKKLEERTKVLSLSEQIKFLGPLEQERLNICYNQSDVVVLSSVEEGFGLVLAEALFCRKPVIGADSGGIPDIIQDGITGILVPPDDSSALADAIYKLLTDEELANRLANSGYNFVRENLTPEIIARKFATIYNGILND